MHIFPVRLDRLFCTYFSGDEVLTRWSSYRDADVAPFEGRSLRLGDVIDLAEAASENPEFARGRYRASTIMPGLQYFDCDLQTVCDLRVEGVFAPGICISYRIDGAWQSEVGDRPIVLDETTPMIAYGSADAQTFKENQPHGAQIRMISLHIGQDFIHAFGQGEEVPAELIDFMRPGPLQVRHPTGGHMLKGLLQRMYACACHGYLARLQMSGLCCEAISELALLLGARQRPGVPACARPVSARQRDLAYAVRNHLDTLGPQIPTADSIAARFATNESSLRRVFKAVFNTTITEYLRCRLLERAREDVRDGRLQIAEIAYRSGFSSPGNFTAAYRRQFGHAPRGDRN